MKEKGLGVNWQQVVGVPREGRTWSQIWLEVEQKGKGRAGLIVMLSLESEEEVMEKGRVIMDGIVNSFKQNEELGIGFISREVMLLKEEIKGMGEGLIGLILADGDKRSFYVGGVGGMRVEIIRNGEEREIWRGGQPVSGWINKEDKIVLGTRDFFERIWVKEIGVGELRTKLGELTESGKVVGLIVEVDEVETVVPIENILRLDDEEEEVQPQEHVQGGIKMSTSYGLLMGRWLDKAKRKWGVGRGLSLRPENEGKKSWGLLVGVIFLMVLLGSVVVGAGKQAVNKEREEYLKVFEPIEFTLEEAGRMKELNGIRARNLVLEAREEIKKQGNRFESGRMADDWRALTAKVDTAWKEVSGEVNVSGEKWFDLSVVKSGIKVERIDINKKLLAWGDDERVIAKVELEDKSAEVMVGGETMSGVIDMAGITSGEVLLTETEIRVVDEEGQELQKLDLEGVKGRVVKGFGNNIYVVAEEDFFRFAATESQWGKRQRFLQAGSEINTSEVVDVAIDGEVWLLSREGVVSRLSQGSVLDFELKPVEEWGEPKRILASEELNRVWVWDKKLGVVEFERETGNYLRKMIWEEFLLMDDVDLDEENKRLMGVKGSEVFVVGL